MNIEAAVQSQKSILDARPSTENQNTVQNSFGRTCLAESKLSVK